MIYLDANATARVRPEVRAIFDKLYSAGAPCANPSSVHGPGRAARANLRKARHQLLRMLGFEDPNAATLVFTSGGTESCALLVRSLLGSNSDIEKYPQHLICTYRPALVVPREWGRPPAGALREWVRERPFITYEPGQLLRNLAIDYLSPEGAEMEIAISTSGSSSVKRCVEAGLGYAIIPAWCMDGTETTITAIDLPELPEIPIYFGEASFLARNPYVVALRQLCVGFTSAVG